MDIFQVYLNQESPENENIVLTKDSFSIFDIPFSFFYLIHHKMWKHIFFVSYCIAICVICFINEFQATALLILTTLLLIYGIFRWEIYTSYLLSSGYKLRDIICAYSEDEAEVMYYYRTQAKNNDNK